MIWYRMGKMNEVTKIRGDFSAFPSYAPNSITSRYMYDCHLKILELFNCEICEFSTNFKVDLTEHFRVFHERKRVNEKLDNITKCYCCEKCNFRTHSLLVLTRHIISACKTLPPKVNCFRCDQCPFKTFFSDKIRKHLVERHNVEPEWNNHVETNKKSDVANKHDLLKDVGWFKCTNCLFKSTEESMLKEHTEAKHYKPDANLLKCEKCEYKTEIKINLKRHIVARHTDPKDISWFKCPHCGFKTRHKLSLKEHILGKHEPDHAKWFKCKECSYKALKQCYLKKHIMRQHSEFVDVDSLICAPSEGGFNLKDKVEIEQVNLKNTNWLKVECPSENEEESHSKRYVEAENIKLEATNQVKIEESPFKIANVLYLKQQVEVEDGNLEDTIWVDCEQCCYKAESRYDLKQHIKVKHKYPEVAIWYNCTECSYKAQDKSHLEKHLRKHNPKARNTIKPTRRYSTKFSCKKCDYESSDKLDLRQHIKVKHRHPEGTIWFDCPECVYKALDQESLARHQASHKVNLSCLECGLKFKAKNHLQSHIQRRLLAELNKDKYVFECEKCCCKFQRETELRGHINLTHGYTYWYKCSQCAYKAKEKSRLKAHVTQVHSNPENTANRTDCTEWGSRQNRKEQLSNLKDIKLFSCGRCSFKAKKIITIRRHTLNAHKRRLRKKRHECKECDYKSVSKRCLYYHIKVKHLSAQTACDNENVQIAVTHNFEDINWLESEGYLYGIESKSHLVGRVEVGQSNPEDKNWIEREGKACLSEYVQVEYNNPEVPNSSENEECSYESNQHSIFEDSI